MNTTCIKEENGKWALYINNVLICKYDTPEELLENVKRACRELTLGKDGPNDHT